MPSSNQVLTFLPSQPLAFNPESKSTITQRGTCLPAPVSEKNLSGGNRSQKGSYAHISHVRNFLLWGIVIPRVVSCGLTYVINEQHQKKMSCRTHIDQRHAKASPAITSCYRKGWWLYLCRLYGYLAEIVTG